MAVDILSILTVNPGFDSASPPPVPPVVPPPVPPTCPSVVTRAIPGCTPYGQAGDVAAVVLRYGAGATVQLPLSTVSGQPATATGTPTVLAGMADAVTRTGGASLTGTLDADGIHVDVVVPPLTAPGVYNIEALLAGSDGVSVATARGLLYVEPSAVFGPASPCGIPTVDEVRQAVRDFPASRRLLGDYEFSVADVAGAVRRAIGRFNAVAPRIVAYDTAHWPAAFAVPLLDGVLAELFEVSGAYFRANYLPYSAGGVSVDDTVKEKDYMAAAKLYRDRWERWAVVTKIGINIESAYGSSPSWYYGYGHDYP